MADIKETFAGNLRRLRHQRGWSQEGLAHDAKINRSYISKLERAGSYAGLEIVEKLAVILDVDPAELIRSHPGKAKKPTSRR